MKMGIYVLYDRIAEECGPVWTAKTDAVAIRNARIHLQQVRPDEYWLYKVGEFDSEKVMVFGLDTAVQVVIPQDVALVEGRKA